MCGGQRGGGGGGEGMGCLSVWVEAGGVREGQVSVCVVASLFPPTPVPWAARGGGGGAQPCAGVARMGDQAWTVGGLGPYHEP